MKITIEINSIDELLKLRPVIDAIDLAVNKSKQTFDMIFSSRTRNCLEEEKIYSIADIAVRTENELLRIPNLGRTSLNEIKEVLAAQGLRLAGKA